MTGVDGVPAINPGNEVQCLDVVRDVKSNRAESGNPFPNMKAVSPNEDRQQSSSSHEPVDAGEGASDTCSPDSCSRMEDSVDGESFDQCFDGWNMVDGERGVIFHPDFVECGHVYRTKPVVMFFSSYIEVKCPASSRDEEEFYIQLRLDDIIDIESWWIGMVKTAKVEIHMISKGTRNPEGVKELKFVVKDTFWYEKQEAIQSLDVRYIALWNAKIDTEMDEYGENSEQNAVQLPDGRPFPEFEPFEDFIYPEGDTDAVPISKRDVDLLEPDTFLNDTLIDFYIKYLKDKIQLDKRQKYHFFNSFFFRKLADLEKYPPGTFDGRAAFLRVRKWTKKVNLFEKDFIFIPVNHNYHWSLLLICHPGDVANFTDEDPRQLERVPCILHMDSIRGTHVDLKDRVSSYLWEEWKERHKETSEDISSKFSSMRFVSLELPQQQNSYDCGLFLLHYVEKFLEEDPVNISPFKIRHKFLRANWFPTNEPSVKRRQIWELIHDLLKCQYQESSPDGNRNKCCFSNSPETENATSIFPQSFSIPRNCNESLLATEAEKMVEMTLFPASLGGSHCLSNSGVSVRNPFEPGSATEALADLQYRPFDRSTSFNEFKSAMASIQENVETCGNFVYRSTENSLQNLAGIATEACDYPCPPRDFRAEVSLNPETSICQTIEEGLDSSPVTAVSHSDKAEVQVVGKCEILEVQTVENCAAARETNFNNETRQKLVDTNECFLDCFPSAPGVMLQVSGYNCSSQSLQPSDILCSTEAVTGNVPEPPDHGNDKDRRHGDGTHVNEDDSGLDSDVQHAAKKMRLTPSSEGEVATRVSKDLCL